jgi:hypothetical protein
VTLLVRSGSFEMPGLPVSWVDMEFGASKGVKRRTQPGMSESFKDI